MALDKTAARLVLEENARYENRRHGYLTLPAMDWVGDTRYTVTRRETEADTTNPVGSRPLQTPLIVLYIERGWAGSDAAKREKTRLESRLAEIVKERRGHERSQGEELATYRAMYPEGCDEEPGFHYSGEDRLADTRKLQRTIERMLQEINETIAQEHVEVYEFPADLDGMTILVHPSTTHI